VTLYKAKGCPRCSGSGYRGRVGVHELLVLNDEMREMLSKKGLSADALKQHAVKSCGMTTLYWDAIEKVHAGVTSIEEVLANIRRDDFDSAPLGVPKSTPKTLLRRSKQNVAGVSAES
jgi:type II secretory ATPase GspE/PulE/Tfp pilus assembly ATPase PilB-like protein